VQTYGYVPSFLNVRQEFVEHPGAIVLAVADEDIVDGAGIPFRYMGKVPAARL